MNTFCFKSIIITVSLLMPVNIVTAGSKNKEKSLDRNEIMSDFYFFRDFLIINIVPDKNITSLRKKLLVMMSIALII